MYLPYSNNGNNSDNGENSDNSYNGTRYFSPTKQRGVKQFLSFFSQKKGDLSRKKLCDVLVTYELYLYPEEERI